MSPRQFLDEAVSYPSSCPSCGGPVDDIVTETEVRELYADGTIDSPGNSGRVPQRPRRMVPGPVTTRYLPCRHQVAA